MLVHIHQVYLVHLQLLNVLHLIMSIILGPIRGLWKVIELLFVSLYELIVLKQVLAQIVSVISHVSHLIKGLDTTDVSWLVRLVHVRTHTELLKFSRFILYGCSIHSSFVRWIVAKETLDDYRILSDILHQLLSFLAVLLDSLSLYVGGEQKIFRVHQFTNRPVEQIPE